jgi:NADH dehydrogenase
MDRGHEVVVLSRHPDRVRDLAPGASLIGGDLTNPKDLEARLAHLAPQAVVHAAAVVVDHDPQLHSVNVEGTAALCNILGGLSPAPRIVYVSTFSVEDIPSTSYSDSKLAAESVVRASNLPHAVMRPALIYGKGDSTNTPDLVARMAAGTQWLPGGGRVLIQPVHVDDVAHACVMAAEQSSVSGKTYRLGGPEPVSVRAYREAIRDASGGSARIRGLPLNMMNFAASLLASLGKPRAQQVLAFHLTNHTVDSAEAQRDLDFQPRALAEGLQATFA